MVRLLLCFLLALVLQLVSAQRAVFNLGKRLKRFGARTSDAPSATASPGEPLSASFMYDDPKLLATALVVIAGALVLLRRRRRRYHPEEDDTQRRQSQQLLPENAPVRLDFEGLGLQLTQKNKSKVILDGSIAGSIQPGRMLAIMGPSGAGKSTVLHALAGRIQDNPKLQLYGLRILNDQILTGDSVLPAAFIEQDVSFFPYMTVRETVNFRVELKLGRLPKDERNRITDQILKDVGILHTADTIVGNAKVRGISGGERKRLSIAVEMISSPSLVLLDEPTSGLDSTAATKLVETLRSLADAGKSIVAVIHQPSQHVFSQFDDVLLVSEGRQMYFGSRTGVRSYMNEHGCRAPAEMGTPEHIIDCISRLPIGKETEEEADRRVNAIAAVAQEMKPSRMALAKSETRVMTNGGRRANLLTQFKLLLTRAVREVTRGRTTIILKLVQQVSTALIYGGIYSLGTNQASIQDRYGLLSLIAIGSMNMALAQTVRSFPKEKAIVSKELAGKLYQTLPYFVGKAFSELPMVALYNGVFGLGVYFLTGLGRQTGKLWNFLSVLTVHGAVSQAAGLMIGAISPNQDVALAMFPAVVVINIIFDGKNLSEENTPRFLRWIPNIGLVRWGFEGLCINEFEGLEFDTSGPRRGPVAKNGAEALARFGLGTRTLSDVMRAQLLIVGGSWLLSYLGLTATRQRYLEMKPPKDGDTPGVEI